MNLLLSTPHSYSLSDVSFIQSSQFEQPERRLGAAAGRTGAKVATNIYRQGGYLDKLGKNLDKVSDLGKLWGQGQAQYLASNKQALLEKRLGAANIYKSGRLMNTLGKNLDKVADLGKLWGQGQAQYLAGNKKEALIN